MFTHFRLLTFGLLWFSVHQLYGQDYFERFYSDQGANSGFSIIQLENNGYMVSGFNNPTGAFFGQDLMLFELDSLGQTSWTNNYGPAISSNVGTSVIQTIDGGFVAVGYGTFATTSSDDAYFLRTDQSGSIIKEWSVGDTLGDLFHDVVQVTSDSSFFMCGVSNDSYPLLVRANKFGDTLWTKQFTDTAVFYAMTLSEDETHLYLCGVSVGDQGYIKKVDINGSEIWTRRFDGGGSERLHDITLNIDGNIAVAGYSLEDSPPPKTDAIIRVVDTSGALLWYETYGATLSDYFNGITLSNTGGYVLTGVIEYPSSSGGGSNNQLYLVKIDDTGGVIWEHDFGADLPDSEIGYSICPASDTGYVVCGQKIQGGNASMYIIKISEDGDFITSIFAPTPDMPEWSIFPNPNNGQFWIDLPVVESKVNLIISDITGRVVFREESLPGSKKFIDISNFSKGIFLVSVQVGDLLSTRKIIIH